MPIDPIFEEGLASFLRRRDILAPTPDTPTFGSSVEVDTPMLPQLPVQQTQRAEEDNYVPPSDDYDIEARLRALYDPEDELLRKFTQSIESMPKRENYKPGLGRRITGGLIALKNPELGQKAVSGGFDRQMEQWKTELDPRYKAAGLENLSNNNMRAIANQIIAQEMSDRRHERTIERQYRRDADLRRASDESARQGRERLENEDQRIEIQRELAKGAQLRDTGLGYFILVRNDGTSIRVPERIVTEEQRARSRASNARDRVSPQIRLNPETGEPELGSFNADTGEFKPARSSVEANTPPPGKVAVTPGMRESTASKELGRSRQYLNNARKALAKPEWAKYIKIKGNDFKITEPSIWNFQTKANYEAMSQAIFGTPTPPPEFVSKATGTAGTTTPTTTAAKPTAKPGMRRVVGPKGETGSVPNSTTTLPKGWRFE